MQYALKRKAKTKLLISDITCFIQVLIFVYSGSGKLFNHHNFSQQLFQVIPSVLLVNIISYTIPVVEIIIALLIVFHRTRLAGMYCFLYLVIIFTAYIIFLLAGGGKLPCSCGGVISALTWRQHVVFNCSLIAITIYGICLQGQLEHHNQAPD